MKKLSQKKIQTNNPASKTAINDTNQNRSMPESPEAEAAVLGSMILDRECISSIVQILKVDSFYRLEHQLIYSAILDLYEMGPDVDVDLVLLRDELKKKSHLEEVGGVDYLVKIVDSVPSSANHEYYANIVKEKQMMRELIAATSEILADAYTQSGDIGTKLDEAEKKIFAVTEKKMVSQASSMKDLLVDAFHEIESRSGKDVTGLSTGFPDLDRMTSGLHGGEMIIIAGRPSMGKTSFAMNLAEHVGADEKCGVGIFSLEMGKVQLAERLLCSRAKIDSQLVRRGSLEPEIYQELFRASGELSEAPMLIDDTPGLTPLEIRAKARRMKASHDIKLILIDYLQLMSLGGRVDSRQQEISTISRYMKALARELDVPVIVLSQLNRAAEQREDHRPRMSDLRESGSIEQDADVVMLLHREDYYHRGEQDYEPDNKAEVIIAKQRNGPTGVVKLLWQGQYTRFEPLVEYDEPF